jgi:exodeoxyribonuclease-3
LPVLLASWNVNSLKARMPRVTEFLERHRPDVLSLQETKCAPEAFPHLELQALGYLAVDHSGGRWNGVAVLVRDDHEVTGTRVGLPDSPVPDEARWVEVEVALAAGDGRAHPRVRVVSLYVVNGRSLDDPQYAVKLDFLRAVRDRVWSLDEPLAVLGDWNVAPRDQDVWDPRSVHGGTHVSPAERVAVEEVGLRDAWDHAVERGPERFTWWDYRAGSFPKDRGMRIDLAMLSADLAARVDFCGIDRALRKGPKPSDHAPLLVRIRD